MGKLSNFTNADEGFTLIEVLLALAILTVAGVVFVLGVGTAVQASDQHRKEATIQTILRNQAEGLYAAAATACGPGGTGSINGYSMVNAPAYAAAEYTGYTVTFAQGGGSPASSLSMTCPPLGTLVNVTIAAQSNDGRSGLKSVTIVLRAL